MCGIAGAFDYQRRGLSLDLQHVDRMVDALAHRGPNGRGVWHDEGLALGHRRLSILDPTAAGAQPMHLRARGLTITYNGEIYNFRELRTELQLAGHQFHTECDT